MIHGSAICVLNVEPSLSVREKSRRTFDPAAFRVIRMTGVSESTMTWTDAGVLSAR